MRWEGKIKRVRKKPGGWWVCPWLWEWLHWCKYISKHQLVLFKYVLFVAYYTSVKLLRKVNTQIFKNWTVKKIILAPSMSEKKKKLKWYLLCATCLSQREACLTWSTGLPWLLDSILLYSDPEPRKHHLFPKGPHKTLKCTLTGPAQVTCPWMHVGNQSLQPVNHDALIVSGLSHAQREQERIPFLKTIQGCSHKKGSGYCGDHKNAPLGSLCAGRMMSRGPQLPCSEIHHRVCAEASGCSQPAGECRRNTKADPFLGDTRLSRQVTLAQGLPSGLAEWLMH